jgi:Protein of unknown function (DUF2961)/Plasmid pRiA4b ORF-3-like protein
MNEVEPAVLRVLDVPAEVLLPELHDILQVAVGWSESHLHQFVADGVGHGMPGTDAVDAARDETGVPLRPLPAHLSYLSDFGDSREHEVEMIGGAGERPGVVAGEGACPPGGRRRAPRLRGLPQRAGRPCTSGTRAPAGVGRDLARQLRRRRETTSWLHVAFRRENPTTKQRDFVICDGLEGPGRFLGCNVGVRVIDLGSWYGEGEVKVFRDGDNEFPTICGTGLEDYVGTAWGMGPHAAPYAGAPLVIGPGWAYRPRRGVAGVGIAERVDDYWATSYVYCQWPQPVPRLDVSAARADIERRVYEQSSPMEVIMSGLVD